MRAVTRPPCGVNHGQPREVTISREELAKLPEYSCSIPTSPSVGRRWRRDLHAFREPPVPAEEHEHKVAHTLECVCCRDNEIAIAWAWAVDENGEPIRGELR